MSNEVSHTLHVSGTHCSACKHLIEETLSEEQGILHPDVSLRQETITFTTTRSDSAEQLAALFTRLLEQHGYHVSMEKTARGASSHEWMYAVVAVAVLVGLFLLLERVGIASMITIRETTLTTAFVIGLVASVSTCLAVVGGLVLSVSATYAHEGRGWRPQVLFHAGRLGGFFILGALLGVVGDALQLGVYGSAVLGALASVVMLVLGIHLLDVTKKVRAITLPTSVTRAVTRLTERAGATTPILLGAATFFLPCGFTQSMQIAALASGSALTGSLTMLAFALGTLPVLALLSFGSLNLAKHAARGIFFKAAGMLVILFALFNLHNALVLFGLINPLISF